MNHQNEDSTHPKKQEKSRNERGKIDVLSIIIGIIAAVIACMVWFCINQQIEQNKFKRSFAIKVDDATKEMDELLFSDALLILDDLGNEAISKYPNLSTWVKYGELKNREGVCRAYIAKKEESNQLLKSAMICFKAALTAFETNNNRKGMALAQLNLGTALCQLYEEENELKVAKGHLNAALEIYENEQNTERIAATKTILGCAFTLLAKVVNDDKEKGEMLSEAGTAFTEAVKLSESSENKIPYAIAKGNEGEFYRTLYDIKGDDSNLVKALAAFEEGRKVFNSNKNPRECGITLNNIAETNLELYNNNPDDVYLTNALNLTSEVLELKAIDDYPKVKAKAKIIEGKVLCLLNELENAIAAYETIEDIIGLDVMPL